MNETYRAAAVEARADTARLARLLEKVDNLGRPWQG